MVSIHVCHVSLVGSHTRMRNMGMHDAVSLARCGRAALARVSCIFDPMLGPTPGTNNGDPATWKRAVIYIKKQTVAGQDLFIRYQRGSTQPQRM